MFINILAIIIAYLFGSISSAIIIVCKILDLPDPRTEGSKNPGATNVLRIGGKWPAITTLLGDVLKGILPVVIAKLLDFNTVVIAACAFAAFLGHLYPIFFRFQGGKGVATLLGALIALSWPVALMWMGIWALIAAIFRYSSLASLTASLLAPFYCWYLTHNLAYIIAIIMMTLILVLRHEQNIVNLLEGKESKLGPAKKK